MQDIKKCKICKSDRNIIIKKFKVFAQDFPDFRGVIKDNDIRTNLRLCMDCGFIYYDNAPSLEELELIYKKEDRSKTKESSQKEILLNRAFSFLKNNFNMDGGKRVIDIGSGDFSLLDKLSASDALSEFNAINVSCPDNMHGRIKVYHTMLEKFEVGKKYDLIILSHILEHIISLDEFFVQIDKISDEDTTLYIEIPFQVGPNLFLDRAFHTQHINYFTPMSLKNLLTTKGYKLESLNFDKDGYFCYGIPGIIRTTFKKNSNETKRINYLFNTLYYLLSPLIYIKSIMKKYFSKTFGVFNN